MEHILVVCFKNGKELTRVKASQGHDFPGGKMEWLSWTEANWRRNGFNTYRTKE